MEKLLNTQNFETERQSRIWEKQKREKSKSMIVMKEDIESVF